MAECVERVLETRPMRVVLDPSLTAFAYRCWPDGCPRGRTCCVGLAVELSRKEVRAIDTLMDELAAVLPHLRDGDGYDNVFVEDPPHFMIESDGDGACPFLVTTRRHSLCGIHSLALRTGRSVPSVKPAACRHWPVTLDVERGAVRITVQPAAQGIGCVAPVADLPGKPTVLDAFRDEIAEIRRAVQARR